MQKFSKDDLIKRLIWFLVGYFGNLYGLVSLPGPGLGGLG
jgi:hypothetical protein